MARSIRRRLRCLLRDVTQIAELTRRTSPYPHIEGPRKSHARVGAELAYWRLRHGRLPSFYLAGGFDRRGTSLGQLQVRQDLLRIRDTRNHTSTSWTKFNYIAVLRDKQLFHLFASAHGHRVPGVIAYLDDATVRWTTDDVVQPTASMARPFDGFAKPLVGIWGQGAFRLELAAGEMRIDGRTAAMHDLLSRINGRYMLQERVVQHEACAVLHPHSLNTVRIVTAVTGHGPKVIATALRVGVGGSSVDNWGAGGIVAALDASTGCLKGPGRFRPDIGPEVDAHPDTKIRFDGHRVPHIEAAVSAVTRFHADLPSIHSIGWDVAITPAGPVVIEANDHWNVELHMLTDPGFAQRFVKASTQ
jgi:hypothetical protein